LRICWSGKKKKVEFSFLFVLYREKHSVDYCAMYDICGKRSDGKVINCPFGSPAVKVYFREFSFACSVFFIFDISFWFWYVLLNFHLNCWIHISFWFWYEFLNFHLNCWILKSIIDVWNLLLTFYKLRPVVSWLWELLFFPARWFAFIKDPKFMSNNYRKRLLYRSSVWHIKDASATSIIIEFCIIDSYIHTMGL